MLRFQASFRRSPRFAATLLPFVFMCGRVIPAHCISKHSLLVYRISFCCDHGNGLVTTGPFGEAVGEPIRVQAL